jgi:hypothetical protein
MFVCVCVCHKALLLRSHDCISDKKPVKSRFVPADNYSWSNVIVCLRNNILSPNFNAAANKICALFKTAIWDSKPILLLKSFESQNTKDCCNKSVMTVGHSELFLCFCAHSKSWGEFIKTASSVSPYLHTKKLYSSWKNFDEIWYWKVLLNFFRIFKFRQI